MASHRHFAGFIVKVTGMAKPWRATAGSSYCSRDGIRRDIKAVPSTNESSRNQLCASAVKILWRQLRRHGRFGRRALKRYANKYRVLLGGICCAPYCKTKRLWQNRHQQNGRARGDGWRRKPTMATVLAGVIAKPGATMRLFMKPTSIFAATSSAGGEKS